MTPTDAHAPRRILFFAYHYPPVGGGSVQRSARFARLLRDHGYTPVVLTGPGDARSRWTPEDKSLGDEVPRELEVHRVPGPEPIPPAGLHASWHRWSRRPDDWTRWWSRGVRALGPGVAATTDLLYVQMQPYESAEPGAWLSRASGKPWVADLLDPWALDEMMIYPTTWHRRREVARMGAALATASAIVMNTPESVARVRDAFPHLREKPIYSISNGFDPDDFTERTAEAHPGTFRIVHSGYLHTELGRQMRRRKALRRVAGGEVPGIDIYTRSHVYLLEAIDRLIAREPELASLIEVHLAGVLSPTDQEIANRSPVTRLLGYLPHHETVALLRSADLVFLPMHNLPRGTRTTIIPGKTWEYLASRRPILAAVPDGDARDVLTAAGSAILVRPDDVSAMAEAIRAQIERVRDGAPAPTPDEELVESYSYPRLTADLAAVFDGVLGAAPARSTPRAASRT
jgi:glycosyltransferase involved in cell wall biosynthesis